MRNTDTLTAAAGTKNTETGEGSKLGVARKYSYFYKK